ncbi:FMN-binding negative transcriptional regulator [Pseudoxanthomonas sp. LH2527]|uniref:FMN-binding negative transcriptional regulator n=1 Tax=Pseudoxanthomonas sp. LH2527 TaxID=2923249 RepID=UPI001F13DFD4|nr:FMN-binding negative transcriptional regulator [Pseudoxanthomonas sp. LH2527]MCH6482036.1 FMN-binding negative transcriptional regulator [Pseudoxanthomonas sp. LH2527]
MYTPRAFVETDLVALDRLIARDAFVTLVTVADGVPCISHLPVLYAREGDRIVIEGHWAKPNPQARHAGPALLIVHGPHAYLSPGWYADKEEAARVPTWNYAVAHLHGVLELTDDTAELASIVDRLSQLNEARVGNDWRFEHDRDDHVRQLRGIVGFRFTVERVELKFKLSQNHPAANVEGAATALRQLGGEDNQAVSELMRERLARRAE